MNRLIVRSVPAFVAALVLVLCTSFSAFAQKTVSGTVYDTAKPKPLVGATVVVQGKDVFAMTDVDGKFTINASEGDVLVAQFMGYTDGQVKVGPSAAV